MQIGFITNCLTMPFAQKVQLAAKLGYQTLEVACWPKGHPKQCDIDADAYDQVTVEKLLQLLQQEQMTISTLAYYENMLDADVQSRAGHLQHLHNVIQLAHQLGVPYVATYIGKNSELSLEANFRLATEVFKPILDEAAALGVTILIENCPMSTWNPEGYPATITYSPELLHRLLQTFEHEPLRLNFDPSHLYWQGIDYLQAATEFAPWIKSVHVKDVTTRNNDPDHYGLYGKKVTKQNPFDFGYYTATLPGYGDLKWLKLFQVLHTHGFDGPLQVEYKNGNGFGTIDDPQRGLALSLRYLEFVETLAMRKKEAKS